MRTSKILCKLNKAQQYTAGVLFSAVHYSTDTFIKGFLKRNKVLADAGIESTIQQHRERFINTFEFILKSSDLEWITDLHFNKDLFIKNIDQYCDMYISCYGIRPMSVRRVNGRRAHEYVALPFNLVHIEDLDTIDIDILGKIKLNEKLPDVSSNDRIESVGLLKERIGEKDKFYLLITIYDSTDKEDLRMNSKSGIIRISMDENNHISAECGKCRTDVGSPETLDLYASTLNRKKSLKEVIEKKAMINRSRLETDHPELSAKEIERRSYDTSNIRQLTAKIAECDNRLQMIIGNYYDQAISYLIRLNPTIVTIDADDERFEKLLRELCNNMKIPYIHYDEDMRM